MYFKGGFLSILLISVIGISFGQEENDIEEEAREVYPLDGLKARRGLDYCESHPNPCHNEGICCSHGDCARNEGKFTCHCRSPYGGRLCETRCPLKICWREYYDRQYHGGKKRTLSHEACRSNVDMLSRCLDAAVKTDEVCHCDIRETEAAENFDGERKETMLSRYCGGTHKCQDTRVVDCAKKVYHLGGSMDSNKDRSTKEKCSMVDEAISCMNELKHNDFTGCPTNKELFTKRVGLRQAQWKSWCLGSYCSLYGCGQVKEPSDCKESSMVSTIEPIFSCIKDKLSKCLPNMIDKVTPELDEVQSELRATIIDKCKVEKQVAGRCDKHKRVLQARELLKALLDNTLDD